MHQKMLSNNLQTFSKMIEKTKEDILAEAGFFMNHFSYLQM